MLRKIVLHVDQREPGDTFRQLKMLFVTRLCSPECDLRFNVKNLQPIYFRFHALTNRAGAGLSGICALQRRWKIADIEGHLGASKGIWIAKG